MARADRQHLTDLLQRLADGDEGALEPLYRSTSAKLFGICLRILKDESEAEDILQEVYVTVWRKAALFEAGLASPITWLAMIARNRAIDRLRKLRGVEPFDPASEVFDSADPGASPLQALEDDEARRRLEECLAGLEPKYAAALRAAFFGGSTYADIAEETGTPLGTVKGWIRRSLLALKKCLER
jgi:RNA polymerase sigma-70 factor (ECF subfamily)